MADVGSASVTVSWEAVADADRYTVTFTRATDEAQEGDCITGIHTASVDTPTNSASIDVGQLVEEDVTNMLRAFSTYIITVVVVSDTRGSSTGSEPTSVFTLQTGIKKCLIPIAQFKCVMYIYRCSNTSSECRGHS